MTDDPLGDFITLHIACGTDYITTFMPPYGDYEEAICPICEKTSERLRKLSGAGRDYAVTRNFAIAYEDGRPVLGHRLSIMPETTK